MNRTRTEDGFADLPIWKVVPAAFGVVAWLLVIIVAADLLSNLTSGYLPDALHYSLVGLVLTVVGLTAYARVVLRRPLRWFAFTDPDRSTLRWTGIALALPAVVTVANVLVRNGEVVETTTEPTAILVAVLGSVGVALFTALLEEFTFRGMLYRLLEDRWNAAVAILLPALFFGLLHTGRADSQVELWLVVTRTVAGGVLFGLIVYRTRNLWNAVAVHAGWNFFLGARIVRAAEPGGTPDPALVGLVLTDTGPLGAAVNLTNTPVTIAFIVLASAALLWRVDEHLGLAAPEASR